MIDPTPIPETERCWQDYLIAVLGFAILLNWILAVVLDCRDVGFKLVPMWILLLSLCVVSKHMTFTAILAGLVLCFASEMVCYFGESSSVKLTQIPPVLISTGLLLIIFDFLAATKLENVSVRRDMEHRAMRKHQKEHVELVEKIKKQQDEAKGSVDKKAEEITHENKRLHFEMLKRFYVELFSVRFKREIPKLFESLFFGWYKIPHGLVFEIESEGREIRLRGHWGLGGKPAETSLRMSEFRDNPFVRWAVEHKEIGSVEDAKKDLNLLAALEKFNSGAFELSCTVPVVVQDRNAFVVFLGKNKDDQGLLFDTKQIMPVLQTVSMTLLKIGSKDARPSFSTFGGGS